MRVIIDFRAHISVAEATPHNGGYYATSDHFGMMLYDDQQVGHPKFDADSPITWRRYDPDLDADLVVEIVVPS